MSGAPDERDMNLWQWILIALMVLLIGFVPLRCFQNVDGSYERPKPEVLPSGQSDLRVRIQTTGVDLDPDGYVVVAAPGLTRHSDPTRIDDDVVTFFPIAPGEYDVKLEDVAANCTASRPSPRAVTVGEASEPATWITYTVTCYTAAGFVRVEVLVVDGSAPEGVTAVVAGNRLDVSSGSVDFADVKAGPAYVVLDEYGPCRVAGSNPRQTIVRHGTTNRVVFRLDCGSETFDLDGAVFLLTTVNTAATPAGVEESCDLYTSDDVISISQTGESVTVTGLEGGGEPWTGTLRGSLLEFGGTRPEDGGTTEAVYSLVVSNGGNDLEGIEEWSWTRDGAEDPACFDGLSDVSGFRIEAP